MRFLAVLAVSGLVLGVFAALGTAQSGGTTWKVAIGGDSADHAVQAQDFFPRTITINAGDTATWMMAAVTDHTVSFLSGAKPPEPFAPQKDGRVLFNPLVFNPQGGPTYNGAGLASSGFLMGRGKSWALTFTKPGRYNYVCLLHPGMAGTVVVQPKGTRATTTQADYDRLAAKQLAEELQRGQSLRTSTKVTKSAGAKGTVYTAPFVAAPEARVSILRFTTPETLTVRVGDTVRWVMKDPYEIHTITVSGTERVPEFVIPEPQPKGPPKIYFNPKILAPAGGAIHTGGGYYNSGILTSTVEPGPKEYALTFAKPGTYTYWCVVHVPEGMRGTIVVR